MTTARVWIGLLLAVCGSHAACHRAATSDVADWKLEVALVETRAADHHTELWIVLTNTASVAKLVCITGTEYGTVNRHVGYPFKTGSCDEAEGFEAVTPSSAHILRPADQDGEWQSLTRRNHITLSFKERSSVSNATWSNEAAWEGTGRDAMVIGDRLMGR